MSPLIIKEEWEGRSPSPLVTEQLKSINDWYAQRKEFPQQVEMNGHASLFLGPAGSGKKMTAAAIGKSFDAEVYRIDLSQVVSKYSGETEKNLSQILDKAENKDWILFFDEADALFGKRTEVRDAHDRYSNQETDYLLQRLQNKNGLNIFSAKHKENIDESFVRRFHSVVDFPTKN